MGSLLSLQTKSLSISLCSIHEFLFVLFFFSILPSFKAVIWGWLLNPVVVNISTRGSADALPCVLTLAAILGAIVAMRRVAQALETEIETHWLAPLLGSGMAHGLAVHLKLYPVIYYPAFLAFFGPFMPRFPNPAESLYHRICSAFTLEVPIRLSARTGAYALKHFSTNSPIIINNTPPSPSAVAHLARCKHRHDGNGNSGKLCALWPTLS